MCECVNCAIKMLTPRFNLTQDDESVTVNIYAPFTHVSETEVFMDGCDFRFFSKPYFLRLQLPGEIAEDDGASAKYEADTNCYVIKCSKVTKGDFFAGLDMITELLKPKGAEKVPSTNAGIEVISSTDNVQEGEEDGEDEEEREEDWYLEQNPPPSNLDKDKIHISSESGSSSKFGYGFAFKHKDVFDKLLEEYQEIIDIRDLHSVSFEDRTKARLSKEGSDFDDDHYLSDLFEPDPNLTECLEFTTDFAKNIVITPEDSPKLSELVRKDASVDPGDKVSVELGLLDILFAFCYDYRTTFGEHSSESGWNIAKLSSTIVCGERFESVDQCLTSALRRTLIYPLFRNWELSIKVLGDLVQLLKSDKSSVVKCLLQIQTVFTESEGRYIFNQLFIEQYLVWVQSSLDAKKLGELADQVKVFAKEVNKDSAGLELTELEAAAEMVLKEEQEEAVVAGMKSVTLDDRKADVNDSDDEDSSDSDSEDSSSDSSTSSSSGSGSDSEAEQEQEP